MTVSPDDRRSPPFILLGAIVLIAGSVACGIWFYLGTSSERPPNQVREFTIVKIMPPPPPPPPPPQQKMVEQPKMAEPEFKEEKPIDKPLDKPKDDPIKSAKSDAPPPGPLSMDTKAAGPGDFFNLGGKPGGNPFGEGGGGGGGGGGTRWGWYASIVQTQIEAAFHSNEHTRNAVMQLKIRLWADSTGHINKVQLVSSTGDAGLDAIIRDEVLGSLVIREPPPKDMPMPMVTRVTARRPS